MTTAVQSVKYVL